MKWKNLIIPFLILFALFILDGTFSIYLQPVMTFEHAAMYSRLLFIGLFYFTFRLRLRYSLISAVFFGLLYDSYYTGVLGVYLAAFLITVYLTYLLKDRVEHTILGVGLIGIIILAALELIIYLLFNWIGYTDLAIYEFIAYRFSPTLLYNAVYYLILYYPLKRAMDYADGETYFV